MKIHLLKTVEPYFSEVNAGSKPFEMRKNDRDYQVGDYLLLVPYFVDKDSMEPWLISLKITSILQDFPGLEPGYCILGIVRVPLANMDMANRPDLTSPIMRKIRGEINL